MSFSVAYLFRFLPPVVLRCAKLHFLRWGAQKMDGGGGGGNGGAGSGEGGGGGEGGEGSDGEGSGEGGGGDGGGSGVVGGGGEGGGKRGDGGGGTSSEVGGEDGGGVEGGGCEGGGDDSGGGGSSEGVGGDGGGGKDTGGDGSGGEGGGERGSGDGGGGDGGSGEGGAEGRGLSHGSGGEGGGGNGGGGESMDAGQFSAAALAVLECEANGQAMLPLLHPQDQVLNCMYPQTAIQLEYNRCGLTRDATTYLAMCEPDTPSATLARPGASLPFQNRHRVNPSPPGSTLTLAVLECEVNGRATLPLLHPQDQVLHNSHEQPAIQLKYN